jgi:hypothetical protein
MGEKIDLGNGSYLEPDEEPRQTLYHRQIVSAAAIPGTRSGHKTLLSCGHEVTTFGNLAHAAGILLCIRCRDADEAKAGRS